MPMTDETITPPPPREPGPQPDPMLNEAPASSAKRWGILIAFAAIVALTVAGVSHKGDQPAAPPAAAPGAAPTGAVPGAPSPAPAIPPSPKQ